MGSAPDRAAVQLYLGAESSWTVGEVDEALAAERKAQARVCRVPRDEDGEPVDTGWDEDLAEALKRRVARNLNLRALPLGIQTTVSEAGAGAIRIGLDYEIRRLEGPFRKIGAKG